MGTGQDSVGIKNLHAGALGHGACTVKGCDCFKFSWSSHLRAYTRALTKWEPKPGDFIRISFIRGDQIAIFREESKGKTRMRVTRWLSSKGTFGVNDVWIPKADLIEQAQASDVRVMAAKVSLELKNS
jgi:hypothetical protein